MSTPFLKFFIFLATMTFIVEAIVFDEVIPYPEPKPHIIVIMADDFGWNDVSFHGATQIQTPNIDALAYSGIILNKHYVLPTCTPSRAAFLTGRYPIRTGLQGIPIFADEPRGIPLNETLLPEYLQEMGYKTHIVGKWHVGYYTNMHTPTFRGFDSFFGYYNQYLSYYNHTTTATPNGMYVTGHDLRRDQSMNLELDYTSGYLPDLITTEAETIIANHDKNTPLFLEISQAAVHASDNTLEVRDEDDVNSEFDYIENAERRNYAGMVKALDDSVGRVMQALNKAGMLENSVVLFLSDNGAMTCGMDHNAGSNYPLRGQKFSLYDGGVRGVAALYSPLIQNSSRISNQLMHITDWLPTFYWLAGGNPDEIEGLDGVNQWRALIKSTKILRQELLVNIDETFNVSAAIKGDYKLVQGKDLYPDYYGEEGRDTSNPQYNDSSVTVSPAALAIANASGKALDAYTLYVLRANMQTEFSRCRKLTNYSKCEDKCLFNIKDDPCERTDISADNPETVQMLREYIDFYKERMMEQTNTNWEEESFPCYFNGAWMPWRNEEYFNPIPDNSRAAYKGC